MSKPLLQIVVGSTRPGRVGLPVAHWFEQVARAHGRFDVELVDLAEVDLPMLDEAKHPRLGEYAHQHTRDWSATVSRGDAFVFVTPEYNHGFSAPLKNALDFLHREWQHKPAGFVSYGGVSGGTRAANMLKPVLSALKIVPMFEAVHIPSVHNRVEDGRVTANEPMEGGAKAMLDALVRWEEQLRPLRR